MNEYKNRNASLPADYLELEERRNKKSSEDFQCKSYFIGVDKVFADLKDAIDRRDSSLFHTKLIVLNERIRNKLFPYYNTFEIGGICTELLNLLHWNYADETRHLAMSVIISLISNTETLMYLSVLIKNGLVDSLFQLYKSFDDPYICYIFYVICSRDDCYAELIFPKIVFKDLFTDLKSENQEKVKCYLLFIKSYGERYLSINEMFYLLEQTFDFLQNYDLYPLQSYKLLNLVNSKFIPDESFLKKIHDIIREKKYINISLNVLESIKSSNTSKKLINCILNFVGLVFEQSVDIDIINFDTFVYLTKNKESINYVLFVVGNMFESIPSTIDIMYKKGYFEMLQKMFTKFDISVRKEIVICCSTAICFSKNVHKYFIETNFIEIIIDSSLIYSNLRYMLIDAILSLLKTIKETVCEFDVLKYAEEIGVNQVIDELRNCNDKRTQNSISLLSSFINKLSVL